MKIEELINMDMGEAIDWLIDNKDNFELTPLITDPAPVINFKCSDGLVAAIIELQMAVSEFLSDWRKGDFTLNKYAELDAQAMEEKLIKLCKLQDKDGN